jgi:glyoxylase-like metal-dependent hydrolase (beta-lactamase superfamily II)
MILIETFPVGQLQCNCSIIGCTETGEAAVIDPGGDAKKIIEFCQEHKLKVKYLLHTHAHFDHILAAREMKEATGAEICLHKDDTWLYDNLNMQCGLFGFSAAKPLPVDKFLEDEQNIEIGKHSANVIYTPGHTPGSLCFALNQENTLFAGDTLFHRSVGRTDLWGGSFDKLSKSITQRLFKLDPETRVVCGHGPDTDIWSECRENPFVGRG